MISPLAEPLQQVDRTWVEWRRQTLAYFAGCDYFRMASHPKVLCAAHHALQKYGLNVAASRWTTGNHHLYRELEGELSEFFEVDSAVLISNGYLTNLAVIQGSSDRTANIFIDEKAHSSLKDAAAASGMRVVSFRHRDAADLQEKLKGSAKPLVMTDGLFAHDGSLAPLNKYREALPKNGWMLVDDSHGAGVLGKSGQGTIAHFEIDRSRVIQTATLSKAFGVFGGVVLGEGDLCLEIMERSGAFGGATPIPLPCAAAALEAVRLLQDDGFRERLRGNSARVHDGVSPVFARTPQDAMRLRKALLKRGIFPPQIRYQNGPAEGYFRFAISSEHTRAQLDALADALTEAG